MAGAADKIPAALKKHGRAFLTWLLCVVSMSETLYIYTEEPVNVYTLFSAAAAAGLIVLFNYLRTKKLGVLVYIGSLITICIISPMFVGRDWDDISAFVRWFFSGAQAEDTRVSFMLALTPFMVFFLTSAFYYFTLIIYRSSMLALVSLIPFALAVKAVVQLPSAYAAVIASLNLIAVIIDGRKSILGGSARQGGNPAVAYTDFALAAVLLALIIPKPSETPYYEQFETAVNMFSFGGSGETVYRGEYRNESGGADDLLKGESVLLYIISTPKPEYMKTQVFDIYSPETGRWKSKDDGVAGSKSWQERAGLLNYEKLAAAIKSASENDEAISENYPFAEEIPDLAEIESYSIVYARNYSAQYVLAPMRSTEVNLSNIVGIRWCARSDGGEVFTSLNMLPPNANYTIRYYAENIREELLESGFCNVGFEEYGEFLFDMYLASDVGSEECDAALEFLEEYNSAKQYKSDTVTEVSAEIQSLAEKITAGLEYDYEKARAIENYFLGGDFTYNLNFEPPEGMDTPEYFLFESKTGICSDFATAFTLLARAAGLTVRYAEGFVPVESEENPGTYYIYTENAHAYPEVYIPGAGWVIFEPTPPNLSGNGGRGEETANGGIDYVTVFLTAIVFVCGFGMFILLIIVTPKFIECIFRIKAKHTNGGKGVIMLYNRHIKNAESRLGINMKAFTPEQAAAFTEEKTGLSLEPLIKPFTAACYGGDEVGKSVFNEAYECYKAQAKAMRRRKKRRNGE